MLRAHEKKNINKMVELCRALKNGMRMARFNRDQFRFFQYRHKKMEIQEKLDAYRARVGAR